MSITYKDQEKVYIKLQSKIIVQVIVGVIVAFISFIIFAKLADTVLEREQIIFDNSITAYILSFRSDFNTKIMLLVTNFGSYGLIGLSFLITLYLVIKKRLAVAIYFMFLFGSGFILNTILKTLIQRPRPSYFSLVTETDFSFPSGHAMTSIIFFITLVYVYYHITKSKAKSISLLIVCLFLTLLIGISRIYLGIHYPSDILAGFVAGIFWFVGIITAHKLYILLKLQLHLYIHYIP